MAYYLKYRPQTIKDLDLASAREDLAKLAMAETLPHSFLFAGPKGTGKTSAARILAKVINCENRKKGEVANCNTCDQCMAITKGTSIDVIEMDAASHRGIDDIRSLRDAVKLTPASAKRKVYIIDEAHMLTTDASNAFLKTLEEPPEHVVFILATTNPEKLISTIRSRTTLVRFKKATIDEIAGSLAKKVKGEKVKVEKDALEEIAKVSDGSFRDADKLLEQLVIQGGDLTKELVREKLLQTGSFEPTHFVSLLKDRDVLASLKLVSVAVDRGVAVTSIIDVTINVLRDILLRNAGVPGLEEGVEMENEEVLRMIRIFISARSELKDVPLEIVVLELAIVDWCEKGAKSDPDSSGGVKIDQTVTSSSNGNGNGHALHDNKQSLQVSEKVQLKTTKADRPIEVATSSGSTTGNGKSLMDKEVWAEVLSGVRSINASTEALLRASIPLELSGNKLKLGVYYSFHKEHLESYSHKSILEKICAEVLGNDISIECLLTKPHKADLDVVVSSVNDVSTVSDSVTPVGSSHSTNGATSVSNENSVLTEDSDEDIIRMAKEIFGE